MTKHRRMKAALLFTAFWVLACGNGKPREAGPNSSEFGDVLFWDVVGVDAELVSCPDDDDLMKVLDEQPFVDGGVLAYRLSESGSTATMLDCTEYDDDACSELGFSLTVNGHEMTTVLDIQEVPSFNSDCSVVITEAFKIIDEGETATANQTIRHTFVGGECEGLIAANTDDNGVGLEDCELVFSANMVFAKHDRL